MPSSPLKNYLLQAVQRLLSRVLNSVATDCEVDAAIEEAEFLDRLEETARRYEAEEKPHLAEKLRCRAMALTSSEPDAPRMASLAESPEPKALPKPRTPRRGRARRGEDA